jgi:hypothetical protein
MIYGTYLKRRRACTIAGSEVGGRAPSRCINGPHRAAMVRKVFEKTKKRFRINARKKEWFVLRCAPI